MTAKYEVDGLNLDREHITGCRLEEREMDILCSSVKEREKGQKKKIKVERKSQSYNCISLQRIQ